MPRALHQSATISVAAAERIARLQQRRDVVDRELDGDLVEAPGQAQHHHNGGGERVERTGVMVVG